LRDVARAINYMKQHSETMSNLRRIIMRLDKLGLMTDTEISAYADSLREEPLDLTDSPAWSNALKVALDLAPVGMVFI
jgi:hypothetical protein